MVLTFPPLSIGLGMHGTISRATESTDLVKTTRVLRLASLLALLQYVAHAAMFLSAKPTHGPEELAVVEAMKGHRFQFSGFSRSYWDFYFGYGLLAILMGMVEIIALWQLATVAKTDPRLVRPMVGLFLLANVAHAILAWNYFFPAPVVGDVIVGASLLWAFVSSGRGAR